MLLLFEATKQCVQEQNLITEYCLTALVQKQDAVHSKIKY